jgi:hypothetical protein
MERLTAVRWSHLAAMTSSAEWAASILDWFPIPLHHGGVASDVSDHRPSRLRGVPAPDGLYDRSVLDDVTPGDLRDLPDGPLPEIAELAKQVTQALPEYVVVGGAGDRQVELYV